MADDCTKMGGGWDAVPAGCAEDKLRELIAAGELTGDPICQAVTAAGYASRGCAYYPKDGEKGPFYSLANPHDYAALDVVDGVPQWDLIGFTGASPVVLPAIDGAAIIARIDAQFDRLFLNLQALQLEADANTAKIEQFIADNVRRAEDGVKSLAPIVEAALPALAGLFAKR